MNTVPVHANNTNCTAVALDYNTTAEQTRPKYSRFVYVCTDSSMYRTVVQHIRTSYKGM